MVVLQRVVVVRRVAVAQRVDLPTQIGPTRGERMDHHPPCPPPPWVVRVVKVVVKAAAARAPGPSQKELHGIVGEKKLVGHVGTAGAGNRDHGRVGGLRECNGHVAARARQRTRHTRR